jgi:hypothetical protein
LEEALYTIYKENAKTLGWYYPPIVGRKEQRLILFTMEGIFSWEKSEKI